MVSIGLVPELSAEAAPREAHPDIVLLSGGADGGNERAILHNAQALADSVLRGVLAAPGDGSLKPTSARFLVDAGYRMFATGLVAASEPRLALRILRESVVRLE